jgi:hypothetical protein
MESFERSGLWWLPGNESAHVAGTLTFTPEDGLRLRTIGGFEDNQSSTSHNDQPIILGVYDDGKLITLEDCMITSRKFRAPGFLTITFMPRFAYVGIHCDNVEDLAFMSVSAVYSGLQDWLGFSRLSTQVETDHGKLTRFGVYFDKPEPIIFSARVGEVSLNVGLLTPTASPEEYNLRLVPRIDISAESPKSVMQWLGEGIGPYQDFLSLGTDEAVIIDSLVAYPSTDADSETGQVKRQSPVEVFYDQLVEPASRRARDHFLFSFDDLDGQEAEVMARWLDVHDELGNVLSLFLAQRYRPMYVDHRFIDTVMALEGYHRQRFSNVQLDPTEHSQRISDIQKSVPGKHRAWLEAVLEYSNEPRLRHRLKEIVREVGPIATQLLGNRKERKRFVAAVVDTRNSIVHPPEGPRVSSSDNYGEKLHWLTERLSWLIKACLLREIGLPEDQVVRLINTNQRYLFESTRSMTNVS